MNSPGYRLPRIDTPYFSRAARGEIPGVSVVRKFGRNADVGGSFEPVWLHSGNLSLFGPSGLTVAVSSSKGDDSSSGAGARTITITGVDSSWVAQTEVLTLNGGSTVTTAKTWGWINSVVVATAGNDRVNVGQITGVTTGSSLPAFIIAAGQGQTQQCIYAIETGKILEVHRVRLSSNASKEANFQFGLDLDPMNFTAPVVSRRYIGNVDGVVGDYPIDLKPPTVIPGPSLLWVEGQLSSGGGSGGSLTAAWDGLLK